MRVASSTAGGRRARRIIGESYHYKGPRPPFSNAPTSMKFHGLKSLVFAAICLLLVLPASPNTVLMVIANSDSLTREETTIKTQFQNWGYTVTTVWDNDAQANFDAAVAACDVVYIPSTIQELELMSKLRTATKGVVSAERYEDVYTGFSTQLGWDYAPHR